MPGIDPVTGLPLDLITPNPAGAPPNFVQQFQQQPLPGATPAPGADLPPGFVAAPAAPPQLAAPIPDLFQPLPAPPPAQPGIAPQAHTPAPAPHAGSHAGPGMVQQFDKQINAAQLQQQSAAAGLSSTQREGADATAAAQGQMADTRLRQAGELAAKQAEVQAHNKQLDAIDAANLAKARDATIPDFWKGRTGALIGSTIAVALSGIGAGLLGSTKNTAQEAIQHNVDQYFHNQKERIDNLYKYAEAQGKLDQQTRLNYAQDLLNLKDQHSYVMQSAADKVNEIATKSKGAADAATTNFLASKLLEQAIKDKKDVRELRSKMILQEAQAESARGSAAESRARAAQGGYLTPQAQMMALKFAEQTYAPFHKEALGQGAQPGPVSKLASVEKVKTELKQAYESGDPNRIAAVTTEVIEKVGPLLAGGRTTANLTKMVKDMNTLGGQIQANIGKMTGGNPVGADYYRRLYDMLDSSAIQAKDMASEVRERAVKKHLGPGGVANNPMLKDRFVSDLEGTFGTATYNGQPLFQNQPGAPGSVEGPPQAQQAPAAAPTHNTVVKMQDGTMAEFDAAGRRVK